MTTARAKGSTIYLNAGDTFSGTNWHRVFGGDLAAELLNLLKPDAVVSLNIDKELSITQIYVCPVAMIDPLYYKVDWQSRIG